MSLCTVTHCIGIVHDRLEFVRWWVCAGERLANRVRGDLIVSEVDLVWMSRR